MTQRRSIAEARDNLARIVHDAEDGEPVEITRRGRTVAVLVSARDYDRLRTGRTGFWAAVTAFRDEVDVTALDLADGLLEGLRDRSTGRPVDP